MTSSSTDITLFKTAQQTAISMRNTEQKTRIKAGVAISFQTLAVGCNLALIYLLGESIDQINTGSSDEKVNIGNKEAAYLIYSGLALIGSITLAASSRLLTSEVKAEYAESLNAQVMKKFSELDLDYTLTHPLGWFVQLIQHGFASQEAIPLWIDEMYPAALELILANTALFTIDWQLGLVFVGALSIDSLMIHIGTKSIKNLYQTQEDNAFVFYRSLIARIQDHANIRLFGRTEQEVQKGVSDLHRYSLSAAKVSQSPERNGLIQGAWGVCVFTIMLSILSARKDSERLSVNYFPMLLIYLVQMSKLFDRTSRAASNLLICGARMSAVNQFMLMPINNPDAIKPQSFRICDKTSSIKFRNVTFRYDKETILDDVSFTVEPGSSTAIIGLSGTGKTTITQLILRSYVPETGTVDIAGYDVGKIRTKSLCTVVGLVPQHPRFPNGTLARVLRDANPDATDQDLYLVLQKVDLSEFATQGGLAKLVGENGLKLSGGQMQRIAIAQLLLKKAYILIFDEPTSALDMDTAWNVASAVDRETIGITSLFVTHNLLSISTRKADKIIVLANGKVVQQGPFNQLLTQTTGHFYKALNNCCNLNGIDVEAIVPMPERARLPIFDHKREFKDDIPEDTVLSTSHNPTNLRSKLLSSV